jgi:uroporphyrin-III C-methyltransferase
MNRRLTVVSRNTPQLRNCVSAVMETVGAIDYEWIPAEAAENLVRQGRADSAVLNAADLAFPLEAGLALAALIPPSPSIKETIAVICREARADIRGLFYLPDVRNKYGKVWLIGAGPGSADLLTLRAQRVLKKLAVVYYDDLVDESILSLCPGDCVYVGKRKGRPSHSQDLINEKLYGSAVEGKTVGRLKGGDPSIFGRAGEELAFLRSRWIPVEVVPGITAASAAAAAGLISLTQRKISKSTAFLSGHGIDPGKGRSPETETRVYYMAASKLTEISLELIREGVSPETPAALVHNAGAYDESIISTTVGDMTKITAAAPALLVVGHIAKGARVERKALFTGRNPDSVRVKEPIIHQALVTSASGCDLRLGREDQSLLKRSEQKLKPLNLSFFSALIFDSSAAVDAFVDIYGTPPDHLLCYASDNAVRQNLLKRSVDPWRIVLYPNCYHEAKPPE